MRVSNAAAITLYESEGFAAVGRRDSYYPPYADSTFREDALVMRRPVGLRIA